MKLNNLIKFTPLLSTLILIFFLFISNQKSNTNLRILLWKTPSLSLGTYLAISIGSGFIFSYIGTTNVAFLINNKSNKSLKYKNENINQLNNTSKSTEFNKSIENILIERDINDPLPTITANFRVIGKTERYNSGYDDELRYESSDEFEERYDQQNEKNQVISQEKEISNDWDDYSYTNW